MSIWTKDDVARIIINVGQEMGVTPRGIVIGLSVGLVESNLTVYANAKVPGSLALPHDKVGSDGMSVGVQQQQVVMGNGWWWGPVEVCQDPTSSTRLFFERLKKRDYNGPNSPGSYAQAVQGSSFPDRYDQRMGEAQGIYDRLAGTPPAPAASEPYGMPTGSNSGGYGGGGVRFPAWVYALGDAFGVKPSTYPGHQESDRNEAGYAPNPQRLNRGIDWAAPGAPDEVDRMQRFADYLFSIRGELEQVIWWNPDGRRIGVAGGKDVTNTPYYDYQGGYDDHRDHVHTRQSHSLPLPGGTQPAPVPVSGPWTGDPVWLADVLRAEGVTVIETPGWLNSGHGDMGSLWGVINHHTGSNGSTWESIRNGRPDLAGPLAQIHLRRDGVAELVAVGVCWHAGTGNYADLGKGAGNKRTIGIEAQNDGGGTPGKPHRSSWPDVQYDALVKCNAAIDRRLGVGASHSISHQEYDKGDPPTFEGKWDPGAIDMNIFRADVAARLTTAPPSTGDDDLTPEQDQMLRAIFREQTQRHPSRSALREPGEGLVDTWAGMDLNIDGNVDLLATYLRAQLKFPPAVDRLKRVAAGGEPGRNAEDALLAQAMLAELYKAKPAAAVATAPAAAPTVINAAPVADTRQLEAEIARLSDQFESLRIAVNNPPPVSTAVATFEDSTGDKIQRAVDSNMDYTDHVLGMDAAKRTALTRALQAIDPAKGDQA